jgi:hypothetical protein
MSAEPNNVGGPIIAGTPLARMLDDYPVPALPADFADRVVAAAASRSEAAPLPLLRRSGSDRDSSSGRRGRRGWRMGRRIVIGVAGFGVLATAAAATGLLESFDIPVPTPQKVWASLTGAPPAASAIPATSLPRDPAPGALSPVVIDGPIDTPEELAEVFRRIDSVREGRVATRRQMVDKRIDDALERRRAAGLAVPSAEEEARLRQRIDEARARRDRSTSENIAIRREALSRKVESGVPLTREEVLRTLRDDKTLAEQRQRRDQWRQMSPQERREALGALPPEERRALIEAWRERRGVSAPATPEPLPAYPATTPSPDNSAAVPAGDPDQQ